MATTARRSSHLLRCGTLALVTCWTLSWPESAAGACQQPPGNVPGVWCFVDGAHVRVWWSQTRPAAGAAKASLVRDEVEGNLWPLYFRLLGRVPRSDGDARRYPSNGGDGHYDIMLTNQPLVRRYGDSPPLPSEPGAPPARFSMVSYALTGAKLRATVAHELMYGFLTGFKCAGQCRWLEEATATWAEHAAYPTANTEHEYVKDFFQDPTVSLDDDPSAQDRHKSGAYLFLFFLQHHGRGVPGDRTIARDIWTATERFPNPLAALNASVAGGFQNAWREFITDNWNADPAAVARTTGKVPIYRAWDRLSDGISRRQVPASMPAPRSATTYEVDVPSAGSVTIPLSVNMPLRHLSAAYFVFRFSITVRSVTLTHNGSGAAGVEPLVFTREGDVWTIQPPNWAAGSSRSFCRDKAGERFDEMVVILGNSSVTDVMLSSSLTATGDTCLTDPGAGFEQCRLSFPPLGSPLRDYQNTEWQSWEVVPRTATTVCQTNEYPYHWTSAGNGSSLNLETDNLHSYWQLNGKGDGCLHIGLQGGVKKIAFAGVVTVQKVVLGTQIQMQGATPKITPIEQTWSEFNPQSLVAPASAPRIEGISTDVPLASAWQPGINPTPARPGLISCRWSWPGAPPP